MFTNINFCVFLLYYNNTITIFEISIFEQHKLSPFSVVSLVVIFLSDEGVVSNGGVVFLISVVPIEEVVVVVSFWSTPAVNKKQQKIIPTTSVIDNVII